LVEPKCLQKPEDIVQAAGEKIVAVFGQAANKRLNTATSLIRSSKYAWGIVSS
jgi:hypothetical protein